MALNNEEKMLIMSIYRGDKREIEERAISCLMADKTEKNKKFCEEYLKRLNKNSGFEDIPYNMTNLLSAEFPVKFNPDRYFTSKMEEKLFDHIMRMYKVGEKLNDMKIDFLNATLLYGESGTGKTMFGKYIAHRMGLPFYYVNFSNALSSLLGETSKNINKIFDYVKNKKAVLMLDEIDYIANKRGGTKDGAEKEVSRATISIMQQFDRMDNGLIILAATNMPESLDPALLRRFTSKVKFENHTCDERVQYLKKYLSNIDMIFPDKEIELLAKENENMAKLHTALIKEIAGKLYKDEESDKK